MPKRKSEGDTPPRKRGGGLPKGASGDDVEEISASVPHTQQPEPGKPADGNPEKETKHPAGEKKVELTDTEWSRMLAAMADYRSSIEEAWSNANDAARLGGDSVEPPWSPLDDHSIDTKGIGGDIESVAGRFGRRRSSGATPPSSPRRDPGVDDSDEQGTRRGPSPSDRGRRKRGSTALKDKDRRKNKFRFKAIKVGLTYSTVFKKKLEAKVFEEWVHDTFIGTVDARNEWGPVAEFCFSQEIHRETKSEYKIHVHGYMKFLEKFETRDVRAFDIIVEGRTLHPNVNKATSPKGWLQYVQKEGDYYGNVGEYKKADPSVNYRKKRDDKAAYEADLQYSKLKEIKYPVELREGLAIHAPDPRMKRRHWWIKGKPDGGKTLAVSIAFKEQKVYMCGSDPLHRWERYRGEDIVIYDDCMPSTTEMLSVSNTYLQLCEVPGKTRYTPVLWPLGHTRTIIVISNVDPPYSHIPAFTARFRCFDWDKGKVYDPTKSTVVSSTNAEGLPEVRWV